MVNSVLATRQIYVYNVKYSNRVLMQYGLFEEVWVSFSTERNSPEKWTKNRLHTTVRTLSSLSLLWPTSQDPRETLPPLAARYFQTLNTVFKACFTCFTMHLKWLMKCNDRNTQKETIFFGHMAAYCQQKTLRILTERWETLLSSFQFVWKLWLGWRVRY